MSGSMVRPITKAMKLGGTVLANSFVKFDTANDADDVVVQCGAGERGIGICQDGGTAGQVKEIDLPGGGSMLKVAGTVTRGNHLKSDASGYGVRGASAGDYCPVMAHASGVANDVVPVFIVPVIVAGAES